MRSIQKYSVLLCAVLLLLSGCVERELTIKTFPDGAMVELNDEQIGYSPVTVPFNWYGTYRVRIEKEGYQTLSTAKELDRPAKDYFPFDLFREIFTADTIDSYEWSFDLEPYKNPNRSELLQRAETTKQQAIEATDKALLNITESND